MSVDFWMVSRKAKNPVLAHTFINWVLGKNQAQTWYKIQGLQLPQNDLTPEKIVSLGLVPERLKTQAEDAASRSGTSLNTWLVRAISSALTDRGERRGRSGRLQGWAES